MHEYTRWEGWRQTLENVQLAHRIRAFRKLKGLTQQQLADHMDLSVSILGAIERGNRKPEPRVLQKISQQLGIAMDELIGSSI